MAEVIVKNTFLEIVDWDAATPLPRVKSLPSLKIMEVEGKVKDPIPQESAKTSKETPSTMSLASSGGSCADSDTDDEDRNSSSPPSPICNVVTQLMQPQHCFMPPIPPHVGAAIAMPPRVPPSGENVLSKLLLMMGQSGAGPPQGSGTGERRRASAAAANGFFSMIISGLCASLSNVPGVKVLFPLEDSHREAVLEVQKIQDGGSVMTVMAVAQACLLESCSKMKEVHLMGYRTGKIFTQCSQGFEARVAYVSPEDEAKACWDLYQKGFCHRSAHCRWRHSDDILTFKIVMAK